MAHNIYHQSLRQTLDIEQGVLNNTFKVSSFKINKSDLGAAAISRQFTISGDKGSKFNIQVFNSSNAFYDFTQNSFSAGFTSAKNLVVTMDNTQFNLSIDFPASSGDTYHILIFTTPDSNTEFTKASGAADKKIFHKTISQVSSATLKYEPTNAGSGMKTMPSTSVVSSPINNETITSDIEWTIENIENDGNGFGLRLIRQPIDTDWYFQTTETVDGAISSAKQVKVDDLTDLTEGMVITAVSSGSLSGIPKITAIDTNTKTLTLSSAQTFADGITLTLRAKGASVIQNAIGVGLTIGSFTATATQLTKTVRTDPTGTTVNLNGTYGISGGSHVKMKGVNVNNNGTNTVQSVTASSSAGSMVMQLDQTGLKTGTTLYFKGSTRIITVKGTITINEYPTSNRDINLNLDNFITLGAAS